MRGGTLILLFWDYVAGLLGQEGRSKVILNHQNWSWDRSFYRLRHNNWKKLWHGMIQKIWSHKLNEKFISFMTKRYHRELQNELTKNFFSLLQLPPWGALRYLYRKNITNIHLLNTETAHRFMRHQNEHSKRAKWVYITRSKNMHFWK